MIASWGNNDTNVITRLFVNIKQGKNSANGGSPNRERETKSWNDQR